MATARTSAGLGQPSAQAQAESAASTFPGQSASGSGGSNGSLDTGAKVGIGIGVGLGVGLPLLIGVIVAIVYMRRLLNMARGREEGVWAGELGPGDAVDEPKYFHSGSASHAQGYPPFGAGSAALVEPARQDRGAMPAMEWPESTVVQPTVTSAPRGPV